MTSQSIHIVGLGGTLKERSTSRRALEYALEGAAGAGASTELLDLNQLQLPMYRPGAALASYDASVQELVEAVRRADGMLWSTGAYHGTLAGATKNALDFVEFLSRDARPYLHGRAVGLLATGGGDLAAVNAINAMVHIAQALRATAVPLLVPIGKAWQLFDQDNNLGDENLRQRLAQLGQLVAATARRFAD